MPIDNHDRTGEFQSPGGFVFGLQGWTWGDQRPSAITFYLDGTCSVFDQHGRPLKGFHQDGEVILLATEPPQANDVTRNARYASHARVIDALTVERISWQALNCAGWPQLPYAQLKALKDIPQTPLDELKKIRDPELRKAALTIRREVDAAREKEFQAAVDE